eukprot:CAMPEP_0202416316 /NCGR_PEP_ID=MMETSP1128-20130828/39209_1 /ASSEMBLY_ACC=CAM_ASM_000463 /TAXON_ID=3047 /ORGANISM="Dunaliella tertiolecta, Strain CCMP1320" /LENGTH=117 /DNA_ID=CAMNT_0049023273 /DNA_START=272 /DNA_END=625 /DNA_ORIENTATION=-
MSKFAQYSLKVVQLQVLHMMVAELLNADTPTSEQLNPEALRSKLDVLNKPQRICWPSQAHFNRNEYQCACQDLHIFPFEEAAAVCGCLELLLHIDTDTGLLTRTEQQEEELSPKLNA